jgi:hypothetical protein
MRTALANFGCLILLILFLPLFIIFIGPLLVLAALRGRQPVGPIILNTSRYGPVGRIGAFMLGLALWILVWSGLAWIVVNGLLPSSTVAVLPLPPLATASVNIPTPLTEHFISPSPEVGIEGLDTGPEDETPTPLPPPFTATPIPLSPMPTPGSTPTILIATLPLTSLVDSTPPLTKTPIITDTPEPVPPLNSDRSTASDQLGISESEVLTAPLTIAEQQAAIAVVEEGNLLLREAISLANQENIQKLESVWRGRAFAKAQNFAIEIYERYKKPFDVQFEYVISPTVSSQSALGQIIAVSQETWIYEGPTKVEREAFEFTYTLNKEDGRWVITQYSYLNLPMPVPTATPGSSE